MLTMPIKKQWFDMILAGEKKEEYRASTPYWLSRIRNEIKRQNAGDDGQGLQIILKNGYGKNAPKAMITLYGITEGVGIEKWGAEKGLTYIRLHIRKAVKWE